MKRATLALAAAAALAIGGGAVGVVQWRGNAQKAAIAASAAPELPDLAGKHPSLTQRVEAATAKVRANTDAIESLAELARLYHANGYYTEAWTAYSGLIQVEPKNPTWPYRLASIVAGYGQLEEALPLYQRSLALDGSYMPCRIRVGDTLLKLNRIAEAQKAYEGALASDGDNAYARVGLARVAIANEDWEAARGHLEAAIGATRFQIGADLLGDVYEKLGLPGKERIVLQNIKWGSYADIFDPRMLTLMDDSYDAYQISIAGGWALHQGDTENGLKYISKAVALDPENPHLQFQIAGLFEQLGEIAKAMERYRRVVELKPDFADAWLRLIDNARKSGNSNAARSLLDTALRNCPASPSLQNEKGDAYMQVKQYDLAEQCYRRSIELRPNEASGYVRLARLFLETNRIEQGLEQMREGLKQEPNNEIAATTLTFQAIFTGDQAAADEWIARLRGMPRIPPTTIDDLAGKYQQRFGAPPRVR